jgi:hypothetical protein
MGAMPAVLVALVVAAAVQSAHDVQATAVALVPLRPLGVPAELTLALQTTLRNELTALPEARIVPEQDLAQALRREPDCDAHIPCAAAAAVQAGARQLIVGTASQLGDALVVDLKLLDATSAQELRRATHPVSGSQDALIETLRASAVELLAPQRFTGSLRVDVPGVSGAILFVDGKQVGASPLAQPIDGLKPGQHTLRVADGRSREVSAFVEIRYGRTTEARVDLGPLEVHNVPTSALPSAQARPPWVRRAAYVGLGLGLASAVAGIVYHAKAYSLAAEINRRDQAKLLGMGDAASYAEVNRDVNLARGLYVTAAVLGAAGGGLLWWDLRSDGLGVAGRF